MKGPENEKKIQNGPKKIEVENGEKIWETRAKRTEEFEEKEEQKKNGKKSIKLKENFRNNSKKM